MGEWFFNPTLHLFCIVENHGDKEQWKMATLMSGRTAKVEEL